MLPFTILHILGAPREWLVQKDYKEKFGSIYQNTERTKSYKRGLYYPLFLMHRYFFIFVVFTMESAGPLQAGLMVFATGFFLYYLIQWRPFSSQVDFCLNILGTICLIWLYLFCLLFSILSHRSSAGFRTVLGYIFIILVLFLFVVNILTIIVSKIVGCFQTCRKRRQRRVRNKYKKRFKSPEHT